MATRSLGTLTLDLIAKIGGYVAPLDQAARKTKKNTDDMKKDFNGVKIAVAALGSGFALAMAAITKSSIAVVDQMGDMSEATGIAIENLSALKYATDIEEISLDQLGASLTKFSRAVVSAGDGVGTGSDAFKQLNINIKNTDGSLKNNYQLIEDVASRFSLMEDGAYKAALAQDLFGKQGVKLIPILNSGAEGLKKYAIEAGNFNQILSADSAAAAAAFNDNMTKLRLAVSGIGNVLAEQILPSLENFTSAISDGDFQQGIGEATRDIAEFGGVIIDIGRYALPLLIGVVGARLSSAVLSSAASFTAATLESSRYQAALIRMAGISGTAAASQVALGVASRGASAAMMLVGGPVGAAILAGGALIYLGTQSSDAEERIERLREAAKGAAVDIDKMGEATKTNYASKLRREIEETEKQIKDLEELIKNADEGRTFTSLEYYLQSRENIELLNKSLEENKKLLDDLSRPKEKNNDPLIRIISEDDEARLAKLLDEDFDKLIKKQEEAADKAKKLRADYDAVIGSLEKQIALYGDTTRVAEVRYDLENGYLDGIDEKQKRHYLNLAAQLDLMDRQRELIAELDEFDWSLAPADAEGGKTSEWAKIAEDAAERINGSFSDAWMNIDKGFTGLRDGIVGGFKRMLAEMAHEAVTKPIVLQIQQSMTGGGTAAGQGAGNAIGAVGAGGWYAAIALAVVAGANVWNKSQEEKFAKMTAEYRQGTQFVGGVLGEGNKKSESISNSIDHLAKLSDAALGINSAMLNELIMLNNNIGLFAAGIAKEFGASGLGDFSHIKTGKTTFGFNDRAITLGDEAANIYFGGLGDRLLGGDVNEFVQGIMGGITTKISENLYSKRVKITDSGIKIMGQSLADMLEAGVIDAYAFADVNTKKKALGVTYSNKTREQISGLDEDVRKQFAKVFENGADALRVASKTFGIDFDKYLDVLRIDTSKISLKGLEGDALTAELEAFFSSTLDSWVGGITTETQRIERQLKSGNGGFANFIERMVIGMEPQFRTVQTKAGELISQYQKVGEGAFETFMRLAGETEAFMKVAERLRLNFNLVGVAAIEVVQEISKAAGGFDELSKAFGNYAGKFLSDADKFAYAEKVVNQAFAELGIAVPKTREAFTALVQGIDITTEQGREQFVAIMRLVDASDMYISALEEQTKAAEEARKAAIGDAFGSLNRAVQAERDLLDKMNQGAIDAIRQSLTEHQAVANSLSAALGAMAMESAQADLMTRRAAQAQLVAANAITKAGGPLPGSGQLDSALDVLARPSQQLFASFEEYARDFYTTQKNLRELQEAAVGQVSIDEQNLRAQEAYHAAELDRLDKLVGFYQDHINALNGIDESVIGVADAVNKLNLALLAGGINATVPASLLSSQALSSAQSIIPVNNRVALVETAPAIHSVSAGLSAADLVAEIKQLREELQASQFAIAKNTLDTRKILDRWDGDGLPQEREEGVS